MLEEIIEEKIELIKDYITEDECNYMTDDDLFNCGSCSCFEDCYMRSCGRSDVEFAKSVDYGGYNTVDDFLEHI